ncbi:CpsB/CapC family capsule biosynthesis tyrosine phosphatase [Virgibacillus sp. YIM 98842]|uniref:tyrosine-protein phosphatase n=1 Tax=Virgibacillus sp. YIM 98842 TaxID=2663533 RepID=UPI0013DADE07|nr:CpsB/CapC family capsule biosynthesis tyrosine phosphatase [Virgibacillus sp. YIM 98842]
MIDIHCHILPGIDDGAQTEADSIAMAKAAAEQGIHTIIATPHHKNGRYENNRTSIIQYTEILNNLLGKEDIPLKVVPGQETRINGDMVLDLENRELMPLNDTKYVFVEFSSGHVPHYAKQMIYDLQVAGYTPIIVHPERNRELIENPAKLYEFVKNGALTQVTAGSVIGKFGKNIEKFTHQLIDNALTHFIASDAHNTSTRSFWMNEAYQEVNKQFGNDLFYMFMENNHLLLDDLNVNRLEPSRIKKKKFFGLF